MGSGPLAGEGGQAGPRRHRPGFFVENSPRPAGPRCGHRGSRRPSPWPARPGRRDPGHPRRVAPERRSAGGSAARLVTWRPCRSSAADLAAPSRWALLSCSGLKKNSSNSPSSKRAIDEGVTEDEADTSDAGLAGNPTESGAQAGQVASSDEGREPPARVGGFGVDQAHGGQAGIAGHGVAGDHAAAVVADDRNPVETRGGRSPAERSRCADRSTAACWHRTGSTQRTGSR